MTEDSPAHEDPFTISAGCDTGTRLCIFDGLRTARVTNAISAAIELITGKSGEDNVSVLSKMVLRELRGARAIIGQFGSNLHMASDDELAAAARIITNEQQKRAKFADITARQ